MGCHGYGPGVRRFGAYIDETGDRGLGTNSSPIFGMAAIVIRETDLPSLREATAQLRSDFGVPKDSTMSWKQHVKTHDRRKRAADVLSRVEGMTVCYVYADKSALTPGSYRDNPTRFYNWVAFKTYKSVVWAARNMGANDLRIRFGHVRRHDHTTTHEYITREAAKDAKIPDAIVTAMTWQGADRYTASQAADLCGGFLQAALWPHGAFGYTEPSYLLTMWPRIRVVNGCAIPLGIMSMPNTDLLTRQPWFPCDGCPKTCDDA